MKPYIWTKQPSARRRLKFDATKSLIVDDTISLNGVTVALFDENDVDVSSSMLGEVTVVGNFIYVLISGGEDGKYYWFRIRIVTTLGELIEDDLKIQVKQTGK